MKRTLMSILTLVIGLVPGTSNAFLCNKGRDLGCLAWYILPYQQAQIGANALQTAPDNYHEWASVSGSVTGSGSRIEVVFRLDQEAVNTLSYQPSWNSAQNILFRKFGLEIDIAEANDGNTLRFDRVEGDDIPSSAGSTEDTTLSDSFNKSKNGIGLIIRDASKLQVGVDYKVFIYLKDPLPDNGVAVTPSFQIVADTRLLDSALAAGTGEPLFNASLLGGFVDKFDYFAVQSENYRTDWKLYRDGRQGLLWTSKTSTNPQVWNSPTSPSPGSGATSASVDPGDRMLAVTTLPTAADPPATQPDFIVNKFWVENSLGNKVKVFYPGEPHTTKAQFKNRGNANSPAAITVKYHLSIGRKVDANKQQVGSDTIQASSLPAGGTHTESVSLTAPMAPGVYNYTVCADTGNVVTEKHESNNCSDELVFEVITRTTPVSKRFIRNFDIIVND